MKILYFASLREALGQSGETMTLPSGVTTADSLRAHLAARGGEWSALGSARNLRIAINQTIASGDAAVSDTDEIAFFPPVTGG